MKKLRGQFLIVLILGFILLLIFSPGCQGKKGKTKSLQGDTYKIIIYLPKVEVEIAQSFSLGDVVYLKNTGSKVGIIRNVEIKPALGIVPTDDGRLVAAPSPVYKDVYLNLKGEGVVNENGIFMYGGKILINAEEIYLTPKVQFKARILQVEKEETNNR